MQWIEQIPAWLFLIFVDGEISIVTVNKKLEQCLRLINTKNQKPLNLEAFDNEIVSILKPAFEFSKNIITIGK
ncbi:MAG: hypothetical protein IPP48_00120 [Chitinophagaceae bacterium]|nr:hypothetical protein [Chitinophagaceae bacterium]